MHPTRIAALAAMLALSIPTTADGAKRSAADAVAPRAHPGIAPRAHSAIAPPVHPATAPPVHPATAPPVHSAIAPPVHPAIAPPVHPATAPRAHSAPAPRVHPATAPRVHPATAPRVHPATAPRAHSAADQRVIVRFRQGTAAGKRRASIRSIDGAVVGAVRGQGTKLVAVAGDPIAAAARIARMRGVAWAEPDHRLFALAPPNDPLLAQLGGLGLMHAQAAWDALGISADYPTTGGAPVAIVDTGIDASHEDLVGKATACATALNGSVAEGSCADDEGHGTHVAGTAAAIAANGVGIAGVAFDAPLIVCKALSADGSGDTSDVAACIAWAHSQGAKVISLSLGGPATNTLRTAVKAAWAGGGRAGSVIVAAAGNDGTSATDYPAGYPEAVSVAAVDDSGRHAWFSNANDDVEVAAPGVDVLSAKLGGGYLRESGTSMATPHAAGAAALMWEANPRASARTIRTKLDALSADAGAPGRDPEFGFGILDLARIEAQ
jgi:thermitase